MQSRGRSSSSDREIEHGSIKPGAETMDNANRKVLKGALSRGSSVMRRAKRAWEW
jgi:hypothetical protein